MNCTPEASLTLKMLDAAGGIVPTSALALPCASVVIVASAAHGPGNRLHTAVLNVWFGNAPVNVRWAVVPVTAAVPIPGEFPVVCWIPPVTVAAGSSADLKLVPVEEVAVTALGVPLASVSLKTPENVPLKGKIKLKLAAPLELEVKEVTVEHPPKPCG